MKLELGMGFLWCMLVVSIGLVNVVNVVLGVNLPVAEWEDLIWALGDDAGSPQRG